MDVKKILFIAPSMRGGGSERVISIILNFLDRKKFEPILVLLSKEGPYLEDLPKDMKIIDLQAKQARYAIINIIRTIRQIKPDIVFSTLGYLNILIAIIKPLFPKNIVFFARESSIVSVQNKREKHPRLFDLLYKYFYNNFDNIIAQSIYMKNDLINNYNISNNKIKVINNPIDINKIITLSNDIYKFPLKNKFNLIAVGRLSYEKGFDLLINAISRLDDSYHLTILGDGNEKNSLIQLSKDLKIEKQVTFLGFQSNPFSFIKQADLFILSSRYEGFPNVVLEANACGIPVIAFNCPGGTQEIIENGINGYLVECGNVQQLADTISKNSKNELFDKSKILNSINKFNKVKIINEYENFFLESTTSTQRVGV